MEETRIPIIKINEQFTMINHYCVTHTIRFFALTKPKYILCHYSRACEFQ
jgi:hypothetical protein